MRLGLFKTDNFTVIKIGAEYVKPDKLQEELGLVRLGKVRLD
jgi:hypothetical protein